MRAILSLSALPVLLGAASDHNVSWNVVRARSQAASLIMIDAAVRGDQSQFSSMVDPTAQAEIWNDASSKFTKRPLLRSDIQSMASACLIEDVSACVRSTQVSFDCGNDKHRLLVVETNEKFKIVKATIDGPPPICEVIKPDLARG